MKISDAIDILEKIKKEKGDLLLGTFSNAEGIVVNVRNIELIDPSEFKVENGFCVRNGVDKFVWVGY